LWEAGGPMVNLMTLLPPNPGVQLSEADQINDRGEIAAWSTDASGNGHALLLIPCDENHPSVEGCDYSLVDAATTAAQSAARAYVPSRTQRTFQWRGTNRYRIHGLGTSRPN